MFYISKQLFGNWYLHRWYNLFTIVNLNLLVG